jgi:putative ABC transport system permease protein
MGSSPTNELSRPLNGKLDGLTIPPAGLVVSETMARWLGVRSGDILDVQFTDFNLPMKRVPVVSISTSYVGITFFIMYMEQATLSRLLDESPFLNGLHLRVDLNKIEELQKKLKQTPQIFGASFSSSSLRSMRVGMDDAMGLTWLNVLLALLIVLGVVYNTVRISLTERRRELASMCLIGYSRAAAWYVVIGDVVLLTLAAIPLGCVVGYGFSFMLTEGASNEIFRVPLWFERWSLGLATLVVLGALSISALFVGRAIKQLDLVSAMKTMD